MTTYIAREKEADISSGLYGSPRRVNAHKTADRNISESQKGNTAAHKRVWTDTYKVLEIQARAVGVM